MSLHTARVIPEERYSCPPAGVQFAGVEEEIDMDLEKLVVDCQAAKLAAIEAIEDVVDGGTCNLDATFLTLGKGVRSRAIVAAIQSTGLQAQETRWLGRGIMIQPPGDGSADRRCVANETLRKSLADAGWRVIAYCQMD